MGFGRIAGAIKGVFNKGLNKVADGIEEVGAKIEGAGMLSEIEVKDKPKPRVDENTVEVLTKDQIVELGEDLVTVAIGLEWDETKDGPDFDADVSALLVGKDKRELLYFGTQPTKGKLLSKDGSIYHTGDNLTGADGDDDADDETIFAQLKNTSEDFDKVVFFVNIYAAQSKGQTFNTTGKINARVYDVDTGKVFATIDLFKGNANDDAIIVGEFVRTLRGWNYKSIAKGTKMSLKQFSNEYK